MNSSYRTARRGTPDGIWTHRKTHFECAVSANSTTGAYCDNFTNCQTFGAQSGTWTRTPKHWYLKPACLPIPPFGHGALAGTWTPNLPIKSRLLCQLSYKHLLRVYHIVLGNADWLFWRRHALRQNFGGPWWVRTINQAVMSRLLYQLS